MFKPKEKRIYAWNDGTKDRRSDPLAIEAAMVKALGSAWRSLHEPMRRYSEFRNRRNEIGATVHDAMCLDNIEAQIKYVSGIRAAFKLGDPCDPADDDKPSLDSMQCIDLMVDYLTFMGELETAARPLPLSPPNLASAVIDPPTENSSVSTPTETSPSPEESLPTPSATV